MAKTQLDWDIETGRIQFATDETLVAGRNTAPDCLLAAESEELSALMDGGELADGAAKWAANAMAAGELELAGCSAGELNAAYAASLRGRSAVKGGGGLAFAADELADVERMIPSYWDVDGALSGDELANC